MSTTIFPTEVWIGADGSSSTMTAQTTTFTPAADCLSGGYDLPIGAQTVNRLDTITDTIAVSAVASCYPPGYGNSLANGAIGFGVPGTLCLSGWTSASRWTETSSSLVVLACCPSSWSLVPGYSHWWDADCMTTLPAGATAWYTPTTATQSRVITTLASVMPARRNFYAAIVNLDASSTTESVTSSTDTSTTGTAITSSSTAVSTPPTQGQKTLSQGQIIGLSVGLAVLALCLVAISAAIVWRRRSRRKSAAIQSFPGTKPNSINDRWDKSELPVQGAERSELPIQGAERSELHHDDWEPRELPATERSGVISGNSKARAFELPGEDYRS